MADTELAPPSLPGQRPQEHKKEGFFGKLFGHHEEATSAQPDFADVDIEEIKRKLGLHEDHSSAPDGEQFLPPSPEEQHEGTIARSPVPAPKEEPIKREEERPAVRVEVGDWTAESATVVAMPAKDTTKRAAKEKKSVSAPEAVPTDSPWAAPHEETPPTPTDPIFSKEPGFEQDETPMHHNVIEKHLDSIDAASAKIMKTVDAASIPDLPEWELQEKELHPSKYFILRNGQPVKSVKDLMDAIEYIDESTFNHHVNEYRNDFAHWVEDAIGNSALAAELRATTDRTGVIKALTSHAQDRLKQHEAHEKKTQVSARKATQVITNLKGASSDIDRLRKELDAKTQELLGERKRAARLVKGAIDKEVEQRLEKERAALRSAITQLEHGKKLYSEKSQELTTRANVIEERERKAMEREVRAKEAEQNTNTARQLHAKEKEELVKLKHDAAQIHKEYLEARKQFAQAELTLKDIQHRESETKMQEEALRRREAKVNTDLTRLHEEITALRKTKEEYAPREEAVLKKEEAARKLTAEAEKRASDALVKERASVARIKAETQKLEAVRTKIDRALSKVIKNKQKITQAVELRKHLERAILGAKATVAQEREELESSGSDALVEQTIAIAVPGQRSSLVSEDYSRIKDTMFTARIAQGRAALENGDLETARRVYNELREEYAQVRPEAPERSALYVAIRELYDDIHLTMLG